MYDVVNNVAPSSAAKFIIYICLIYCLLVTGVEINIMSPVTAVSGSDAVTLPCVFETPTKDNIFHVHWSIGDKYGPTVLMKEVSGQLVSGESFKGRVTTKDNSSLVLYDPVEEDSGLYTCTVIIPLDIHPTDSKSVELTVSDKSINFAIIGISIGSLGLLIALLFCCRRCIKQKCSKNNQGSQDTSEESRKMNQEDDCLERDTTDHLDQYV